MIPYQLSVFKCVGHNITIMASGLRASCETSDCPACQLCGKLENLRLCAKCKETWYCSREHQKTHWKRHKQKCCKGVQKGDPARRVSGVVGGGLDGTHSQKWVPQCDSARTEGNATSHVTSSVEDDMSKLQLDPGSESKPGVNGAMQAGNGGGGAKPKGYYKRNRRRGGRQQEPEMTETPPAEPKAKSIGEYVVKCLNDYGLCVVDNFLGEEPCRKILDEVKLMQEKGHLNDGELVHKYETTKKVRGDKIAWTEKGEPGREYLSVLIQTLDNLIMSCSRQFGRYVIGGRTKVSYCTGNIRCVFQPRGQFKPSDCVCFKLKQVTSQAT